MDAGAAGSSPSSEGRAFVWVKPGRSGHGAHRAHLQLDGVGFLNETRRCPQRELMSQVLGYVGLDNTGMASRYAFEDQSGRAAKIVVQTDVVGRWANEAPSTDSHTIVLWTVDPARRRAGAGAGGHGQPGEAGVAVVVDPWTGGLAVANFRPSTPLDHCRPPAGRTAR
jgi:hypothetical protein